MADLKLTASHVLGLKAHATTPADLVLCVNAVWDLCVCSQSLLSAVFLCGLVSYLFILLYLSLFIAIICLCLCVHTQVWIWLHIPSLEFTLKHRLSLNSWSPPASASKGMRLDCRHNSHRFHRLGKWGKWFSLLPLFSAPNPVRNLSVETQNNSSITLSWDKPEGHDLTYWIQWLGEDYSNVSKSTTNTSFVVDSLAPASTYKFFVWVEKNEINSTTETLNASTGERQNLLYSFFILKGRVYGWPEGLMLVVHTFNPSSWTPEPGRSLWLWGWPALQSEFLNTQSNTE